VLLGWGLAFDDRCGQSAFVERRIFQRVAVALFGAACMAILLSACGDASGCGTFRPKSAEMAVGESIDYQVEIVNNSWGVVDLAGWYWAISEPAPQLSDGSYAATATRTAWGTMVITIAGQRPIEFVGPMSCE
jgi:hypothetical protein